MNPVNKVTVKGHAWPKSSNSVPSKANSRNKAAAGLLVSFGLASAS